MYITNLSIKKSFIILIVISLATAPSLFITSNSLNLLLLGTMSISPLLLLVFFRTIGKVDLLLLAFMLIIILSPLINHPETMRWSTVLYSCMFLVTFIAYKQMLHRANLKLEEFMKLIKYLILAYTIVLVIQQICVLLGLPIFNLNAYDPSEPWKLNSLSSEPSHSARIVGLLMFCFILTKQIILNKKYDFRENISKDKWIWISFLWTMITMGSGTAFLFIFIVLSTFLSFRNIFYLIILVILSLIIIDYFNITAFDRTINVFLATLTFNTTRIIEADPSASVRIVPFLVISQLVDFISFNDWFGYGVDYVKSIFSTHVNIRGLPEGWTGGGMFQIWLDFGLLAFIIFVVFSLYTTYLKENIFSLLFWFFLVFMYGVNNQIVWITIILLFTLKFLKEEKERYLNEQ